MSKPDIVDRLLAGESCNRDAARAIVKLRTAVMEMTMAIRYGRSRALAKMVADMYGPKSVADAYLLNSFHQIDLSFDATPSQDAP